MVVVQMAAHQVIDMIAVGYSLVTAIRTVNVFLVVSRAIMSWRAFLGIGGVHFKVMVIHVIAMRVVHVTVVKIIRVAVVLHSRMTTVGAMLMAMSA
jgi:hypothetical protein